MLRLLTVPHDGGAKDGEFEMSLGLSRTVVGMERLAGGRFARPESLEVASAVDGDFVRQRSPLCFPKTSSGNSTTCQGTQQRKWRVDMVTEKARDLHKLVYFAVMDRPVVTNKAGRPMFRTHAAREYR